MFMGKKSLFPHLSQVKSDFIDAFSNAEKQVLDYQSRLEALNNNFCKVGAFLNKMFQYIAYHRFYSSVFPKFFYLWFSQFDAVNLFGTNPIYSCRLNCYCKF